MKKIISTLSNWLGGVFFLVWAGFFIFTGGGWAWLSLRDIVVGGREPTLFFFFALGLAVLCCGLSVAIDTLSTLVWKDF